MNRLVIGILVGTAAALAAASSGCGSSVAEFGTGGAGHGGATAGTGGTAGSTATGDTSSSSGSPTTSSSSSGSAATSSSSSSSSGSATTSSSSSSSSGSATTSSSSSSGGGGCTADPQDDACVKCSKQNCCAELVPCQNDQSCVCWTGCLAQNPNNPNACFGCGNYDTTTSTFVNCATQKCGSQCGGGSTSTSSSSSSSSGGLCAPAAGDSQCTSCAKMKCCSQVNACAGSNTCVCWVGCLAQGGSTVSCFQTCGVPDQTTNALSQCSNSQCPGMCP